jgi:hypothetical protein
MAVYPERDMTSTRVHNYAVDLDEPHQFLCSGMASAQKCYQGPADVKRLPVPNFKVGDQVFMKAKYFRSTCPSKKLSEKNLGPYMIIMQAGSHSFTIRLPESMRAVLFHVSQLKPCSPNTIPNHIQPPPPPIEVDGEPEFEIAEILDSNLKIDKCCKHCQLLYLVCCGECSTASQVYRDSMTFYLLPFSG